LGKARELHESQKQEYEEGLFQEPANVAKAHLELTADVYICSQ